MQKEKTIQFWDNYHDENHSEEWISKPGEDLLAMISDQIDAGKGNKDDPRRRVVSILEIGCGTSTLVRDLKQYIEERNPMIDVVACGTDVSSVCIEVNRKRDCPLYSSNNTDSNNIDNRLDDETSTARGLLWYEVLNVIDGEPSRQNWDLIIDKGCLDTFLFRSRQRGTHNKTYPESLRILLDNIHGWQSTAAAIKGSASVSDGIDGIELHDDEERTNRQEQRKPGIYVCITPRPKLKAVRDYAGFSTVRRYSLPKIYRSKLEGRKNNDTNSEGLLDRKPSDNGENNSIESQKASTSTNSPGFMFVCVKNDDYQVGLSIPFPTASSRDGSNNPPDDQSQCPRCKRTFQEFRTEEAIAFRGAAYCLRKWKSHCIHCKGDIVRSS